MFLFITFYPTHLSTYRSRLCKLLYVLYNGLSYCYRGSGANPEETRASQNTRRLIIKWLKLKLGVNAPTPVEMKKYFQKFGNVVKISADKYKTTRFVVFSNATEATGALSKEFHIIHGCEFRIIGHGCAENSGK